MVWTWKSCLPNMEIADPRINPALVPDGSRAVVIAEHQTEYKDLPSVRTPGGQVITRWTPTTEERAAVARGEDIFVTILSCGAINPLFVTIGPVNWKEAEGQ
jgi:hypothetical protein